MRSYANISTAHYRGFEEDGETVKAFLGDQFRKHLKRGDKITFDTPSGEALTVSPGQWIIKRHMDGEDDLFLVADEPDRIPE